jgi:hypothetical protein
MMKVNGKKLFNFAEVEKFSNKFGEKIVESQNKIEQIKKEIERLDVETDELIEKDILSDDNTYSKELSNVTAKKANLQSQLDTETNKLTKINDIMSEGLKKIIPEMDKQTREDMSTFDQTVEKEIYRQLQEVRQEQERLLLTLQVAHNSVSSHLYTYNTYCEFAKLDRCKRGTGNDIFHNNLFVPNRSFPELGSPLLNASYLPICWDVIWRSQAEANSMYNRYEDNGQLPPALKLEDINLQEFLDSLEVK